MAARHARTRESLLEIFNYTERGPRVSLTKLKEETSDEEEAAFATFGVHFNSCKFCQRGVRMKICLLCAKGQKLADDLTALIEADCTEGGSQ